MRAPTTRARAGYTLIEITISVALLAMILGTAAIATQQGYGAFRSTQTNAALETTARRALRRVASELLKTGVDVIFPDPAGEFGTSELNFREVIGVTGDVIDWGPQLRLALEYEAGEVDDGLDNNGNGLVDEGVLVLIRNVGGANEVRAVICRNVSELLEGEIDNGVDDNGNGLTDEAGFSIGRTGDVLQLSISVEGINAQGRTMTRTIATSIRLRN